MRKDVIPGTTQKQIADYSKTLSRSLAILQPKDITYHEFASELLLENQITRGIDSGGVGITV